MIMLHTFVVYVENKLGVLNRVASLFRRRAFNIDSLTVRPTDNPSVSRMTIVVDTNEAGARLVEANLYKQVNVLQVDDITSKPSIFRELALIKTAADSDSRDHIIHAAKQHGARVLHFDDKSAILEITDLEERINSLITALRPFGILEMVRTGRVGMTK